MRYAYIARQADGKSVSALCRALRVSRSGYYAWSSRTPSRRHREDARLLEEIRQSHARSRGAYGARKVWAELRQRGFTCGRHRVARLRRENGIETLRRRRFRRIMEHRRHTKAVPNVLQRRFDPDAMNRVWVGDITWIRTRAGKLYLAVVLDLFARRVVGWAMAGTDNETLALDALKMALERRRPPAGLIHHTDQGVQYTAREYRRLMSQHGIAASNSAKGSCYDNAAAESFFSSLKNELTHHHTFETTAAARTALFEYMEAFYNRQRLHQTLGYRTPAEVENAALPTRP